ncbi:MAG: hypothetical protein ABH879_07850 [archaeon]
MHNFFFLPNAIIYLGIAVLSAFCFISWRRNKAKCSIGKIILVNGTVFLFSALMMFVWAAGLYQPSAADTLFIESIANVASAAVILVVAYYLTHKKWILSLLFTFLLVIAGLRLSLEAYFIYVSVLANLLIMLSLMSLLFVSNRYLRHAAVVGLVYSWVSLSVLAMLLIGRTPVMIFRFLPNLLLVTVFFLLYLDIRNCHIRTPLLTAAHYPHHIRFALYIVFILAITSFTFLSTVALHEMGHALVAQYYGCSRSRAVIYDIVGPPHTELICSPLVNGLLITLGGLGLTTLVAAVFFLSGCRLTRGISYLLFSFGLIISYSDMKDLMIPQVISVLMVFYGVLVLGLGIVTVSVYRIRSFWFDSIPENHGTACRKSNGAVSLVRLLKQVHGMTESHFRSDAKGRNWASDMRIRGQLTAVPRSKSRLESAIIESLLNKLNRNNNGFYEKEKHL